MFGFDASLRRRFFFSVFQIAGVLFPGLGHRRAASVARCADGAKGQVTAFDRRPQKAGFVGFHDPDRLRLVGFQFADFSVQTLVPTADVDFITSMIS